ncbi:MAG: LysM peptidoglycan-binding domain-containing protein, partial [Acidimicrobiia bacterium]|nr:LysM peptidoglycan-binding domain-containing protein [Acidimicrobiia bacterium]
MTDPSRGATAARGLGSLALVVAVLVLPPLFLTQAIGWPLPTSLPTSDGIERVLRFGPSDTVVINTIAVVAWLVWAQVAVALLAEIVAVVRGRPRVTLPVLPGTQALAGRLAAGLVLLATSTPGTALASPVITTPTPVVEVMDLEEPPDLHLTMDTTPGAEPAEATSGPEVVPTITVQRHDTYWAIAERALGDGVRWRQIHDLNVGRTMVDGHVIASTSDLLRPGWILELPADATTPTQAHSTDTTPVAAQDAEVTVAPGDQLWGIAEDEMASRLDRAPSATKIAPFWRDLIDANRSRLVDPNNPSLVHPGQTIAIPGGIGELHTEPAADGGPDDTPATTEPDVPDDPAEGGPTELTPSVATEHADAPDDEDAGIVPAARAASPPDDVDEPRDVRPALAVGGLTSLALAVGVKRMRRHRFMRQHPGQVNRGTPDADLPVHRAALLNGDDQPIDDLRAVLGCLAEDLAAANGAAQPRVVQHSLDHVDVFLAAPDLAPPDGWNPEADGAVWTLDPSLAPRSSRTCAAPLLVTLGQPDDDGQIYLDLEADGVISLVGDPDSARGLARSILTELSLGPLTDTVQIVVVGDLVDISASALEHVTLADTWDEAVDKLEEWAEGSHAALVANGWPNTFVARGADEFHDALSPLVVIAAKAPPGEV